MARRPTRSRFPATVGPLGEATVFWQSAPPFGVYASRTAGGMWQPAQELLAPGPDDADLENFAHAASSEFGDAFGTITRYESGSVHFYEFLEALYWLDRIDYEGWISLDPHPLGEEETRSVEEGVRFFEGALGLLGRIGSEKLGSMLSSRRAMDVYRELHRDLFRLEED